MRDSGTLSPGQLPRFRRGNEVLNRLRASEQGQSLVEAALVFPVLLVIMTGILSFGLAFNNYLILTNAVGAGGRALAIARGNTTDPCSTASTAVAASAVLLKSSNISYTWSFNGNPYSGTSCSSSSTSTGAAGNLVQGQNAQITITYPCSLAIFRINLAPSCQLTASTTELVQ
ncbi:TadE-like protein [Bryocella elongata]|uniref:TadE-like protein n=1 Tax=Bryocella elongata TaxID=863522 RepID=A0A1H5ZNV7_9BACT|nr:TadE family protein [Bryocella elongata]SEG37840.1 TadE-like protein [Bryocella elongata]